MYIGLSAGRCPRAFTRYSIRRQPRCSPMLVTYPIQCNNQHRLEHATRYTRSHAQSRDLQPIDHCWRRKKITTEHTVTTPIIYMLMFNTSCIIATSDCIAFYCRPVALLILYDQFRPTHSLNKKTDIIIMSHWQTI